MHGTIEKDICDGVQSRIIISESDYDNTIDYREYLYRALELDLAGANLVIIGYSLSDTHIKEIVNKAIEINNKAHSPFSTYLLLYTENEDRASLYERRGVKVSFGSLDNFFFELGKSLEPDFRTYSFTDNPLDIVPNLNSITIDVEHAVQTTEKNVSAMYQGWPASYSDCAYPQT